MGMELPKVGIGATEERAKRLLDSYRRWTGVELIQLDPSKAALEQLFQAPIVILSHGTEEDPLLNFGNRKGLELWEMDWQTLIRTPSRLTAEPLERQERERFFEAVTANGFVDDYTGIRISSTGLRFFIMNATVWNVIDENDQYRGQAAAFKDFRYLNQT